jgi:formylglycine-generating enzyme required for sulfatase activity
MYFVTRMFILALLICGFTASATATEPTRALKIIATDASTHQTGEVELYRKSVAVIIGIDQYANLPADKQLTYAVKDAKGVADVLKRQYKFDQIITLYNKDATRKRITKLLLVELPKQLGKEDALFIFWAGHGNQLSYHEGDIGYLIPYDGDPYDLTTDITMVEIRDTISKVIPAKHIFYVMDACYSGLLADTRSVDRASRRDLAYLQDITKERVRQVLTAGGKNQEVLDGGANGHSVFTGRLIELLEKTGDFITANEIQAIIKEKVNGDARARNHPQTPAFGTFYGSGDFVFIPSLEQKVADNRAEIAKLEVELKAMDAAATLAKQTRQQLDADLVRKALAGKLKAEQFKKDGLATEEQRRQTEETERTRLMSAKSVDDQRLAQLKADAEAKRKTSASLTDASDFPTLASAGAEIKRLNAQINSIEAGYETELAQTRKQVFARYAAQLAAVDALQKDEFEIVADFNAKKEKQRNSLNQQREAELARLNATALAAEETAPLRLNIQQLANREYTVGAESLNAELGLYNAETHQFALSLSSKTPLIKLALSGSIPLPLAEAKAFKKQWVAGLVRPEAKVKAGSNKIELALVNDASNERLNNESGEFMTAQKKRDYEQREIQDRSYRGEMIKIPNQHFEIGKTEVTQAQWRAVMGNNPSHISGCDNCAVDDVSWDTVQEYLQKLNAKTGEYYRLPTEAEWELACYADSKTEYCGGNDVNAVAWYDQNSGNRTRPVGQKQANGFGLFDMSGNVWEWMSDCYDDNCGRRVLRGGSWYSGPRFMRADFRFCLPPGVRDHDLGFRVARTLP